MKSLDFMIVGAQKSGTTALAEFLAEHPAIEMAANKEAHLFDDREFDDKWTASEINERYAPLFSENQEFTEHQESTENQEFTESEDVLRGEATPVYLYLPEIAQRLYHYNPDLKLIVLLRDPVERGYSQYCMESARGNETLPFWLALLLEPFRLFLDRNSMGDESSVRRHSYRDRGYYARQLHNLMQVFDSSQVLILRTEDLRLKHEQTMGQIFAFLGVAPIAVIPREIFSQSTSLDEVPVSSFFLKRCFRRDLLELENLVDFSTENWRA